MQRFPFGHAMKSLFWSGFGSTGLKEFDYASDMTDDSSVPASVPAMKRKQQQQQRHAGEMQRQSNDKAIKHRRTSAKNKPAKRNGNKSGHEYKDHDSSVQLLGLGKPLALRLSQLTPFVSVGPSQTR